MIQSKIEKLINQLKDQNSLRVLVACSGGLDSTVLLDILNKINIPEFKILGVLHVNHNLREESKDDEEFVVKLAKKYSVPCYTLDVCPIKLDVTNESWGREVRYDFFKEKLINLNATHVFTGHHFDDELETFIFRLIMGRNNPNLDLILPLDKERNLVRPLIDISKDELTEYANKNDIKFVTDKTNFDQVYARNFIRHSIIPAISKLNPSYPLALSKFIDSIRSDSSALERIALSKLDEKISIILELDDAIAYRVLIHLAKESLGERANKISIRRYKELLAFLRSRPGGEVLFDLGSKISAQYDSRRHGKELEFLDQDSLEIQNNLLQNHSKLKKELKLGEKIVVDCPLSGNKIAVKLEHLSFQVEPNQVFGLDLNQGPVFITGSPLSSEIMIEGVGRKRISRLIKENNMSLRRKKALFYFYQGEDALWIPDLVRQDPNLGFGKEKYSISLQREK